MLKPGRERALQRRHPWIFSGAIARVDGTPAAGDTVTVVDHAGGFLARGAWNAASSIRVRVWDWREGTCIDAGFFRARLAAAWALRERLLQPGPDAALRLVHGEADGLPGVVVDRYGRVAVLQMTSAGAQRWRDVLADALADLATVDAVYERSDADVMALEGLSPRRGLLRGVLDSTVVVCAEHGLEFQVDLAHGHKTGFYLDQRENRATIGALATDREVLDCFSYSGGFTVHALAHGARAVTAVDSSAGACVLAQAHVSRNGLPAERCTWIDDDVFRYLRKLRDQNRRFDLIVLDPPKFAPTAAGAERAARGYKDINLLALKLLRPGGLLATFSCSGGIGAELFRKIVAGAAQDAGVDAHIVRQLHAAPDHPVTLAFPEGEYLKGLLCHVAA